MAKRRLTRRQAWRVEKIQQERTERAQKRQKRWENERSSDFGGEQLGLVIAHYGTQVDVESTETGTVVRCHLRANIESLVAGDRVIWCAGEPTGVVVALQERQSQLARPDHRGQMRTIAANIDRMVIVVAPKPEPHGYLIDRYLVAAQHFQIPPVLLINKADLLDQAGAEKLIELEQLYQGLDFPVIRVSSRSGEGMASLHATLNHHISVFVGQSGVGKSSLIQALLPGEELRIGELSEATGKGRHTTTTARLFHFPSGGDLIDSPGIREFSLWEMAVQELAAGYREFTDYLGHCQFRNCSHVHEPGCAILAATEGGEIPQQRLDSYHWLLADIQDTSK